MDSLVKSMLVQTNDTHLVIYISTMIRSITALHDLVNNKLQYGDLDILLKEERNDEPVETTGGK